MSGTDHPYPKALDPSTMTLAQVRKIFDDAALAEPDPDKRANIELCREYVTNPAFRTWLSNTVAGLLGVSE